MVQSKLLEYPWKPENRLNRSPKWVKLCEVGDHVHIFGRKLCSGFVNRSVGVHWMSMTNILVSRKWSCRGPRKLIRVHHGPLCVHYELLQSVAIGWGSVGCPLMIHSGISFGHIRRSLCVNWESTRDPSMSGFWIRRMSFRFLLRGPIGVSCGFLRVRWEFGGVWKLFNPLAHTS